MREDKGSIEFITGEIKDCGYIDDKEPEYPHIIEEIDVKNLVIFDFMQGSTNAMLGNKINEIIREVNKMIRGGSKI